MESSELQIIAPKPTWFNNYYFRSKLEAKWAVFFEYLKIKWTYEPESFMCDDGSQYTPDFFLPDAILRDGTKPVSCGRDGVYEAIPNGVYVEIKPYTYITDSVYEDRIVSSRLSPLILLVGDPFEAIIDPHTYKGDNKNIQLSPWWDNYMVFMFCEKCRRFKFEFDEGNYYYCPFCGGGIAHKSQLIGDAAEFARNFRFQFYDPRNK